MVTCSFLLCDCVSDDDDDDNDDDDDDDDNNNKRISRAPFHVNHAQLR